MERGPVTPSSRAGEAAFNVVGCAACHLPNLTTGIHPNPVFDRKPVPLFSDLLLHDVGTGDGIERASAQPDEMAHLRRGETPCSDSNLLHIPVFVPRLDCIERGFMFTRFFALLLLCSGLAHAQVSSNASLTGSYYFRHVLLVSDGAGGVSDTRTAAGTLTFNGSGSFTYTAQQLVGTAAPAALNGAGTYTVKPGGMTTLTNPQRGGATINARLGTGALVGTSTEAGANVFDLFVAIPVSSAQLSNATLTGPYYVSSLEFAGASVANIRETNFKLTANGSGSITETAVTGQARNLNNHLQTQTVGPMTYSVSPDGSGVLNFPLGSGQTETSQLIAGSKTVYVSQDGTYFIGGSMTAGSHGLVTGVKSFASGASNASWSGFFYSAGLRFDADRGRFAAVSSSVNAIPTAGAVFGGRTRQSDGLFDASTLVTYTLGADGSGPFNSTSGHVNVGSTGGVFSTSGVDVADSASYTLSFGTKMPPQSGSGVFIDPQRVLNGASFALGYPVSPGGFVTLFGTGLSTQTATAATLPFPLSLGGVTATVNGKSAPIYFVSPTQISLVVPYSTTGSTATVVVTANNVKSNSVEVPLAATAPGIFSLPRNGLGDAAILHADYSVVNADSPAKANEVVQVFLSGLGAVQPAVNDGAAAPGAEPLARTTTPLAVTIDGLPCTISYSGLAPGLASLYQLNIRVPSTIGPGIHSLAVQTVEGFTDMVNIRTQ